jgi:beta-glucosidase
MKKKPVFAILITGLMIATAFFGCIGEKEIGKKGTETEKELDWIDLNKNGIKDPYEDPSLPFKERTKDLVSRMTFEEKIPQMQVYAPAIERLGIPAYNWRNECLHGAGVRKDGVHTVFPQAIGMAAAWNPDLIYKVSTAISDEARAEYHKAVAEVDYNRKHDIGVKDWGLTFWSPVINIGRDPRWGRTEEGYGEDPYLTSRIGVAFVKGLQGEDPRYLKAVSTPKHFAVNNEEDRRHYGSADVDERILREYYLPHFKVCVKESNAQGIMGAYNAINGVPCCANKTLLTDILRNEWGFDGFVVSDLGAIADIYEPVPLGHHYVSTAKEATALALKAGIDLDDKGGSKGTYRQNLEKALKDGLISEEDIDRALRQLFTVRFRLGMFDPPEMVPYSKISYEVVDCEEHRALALQTAHEAIVLLKNEDNLLPLDKDKIKSIAVIGPNADETKFGGYSSEASKAISPLEGIENKVFDKGIEVKYAKGCSVTGKGILGFYKAINIAKNSDVAIVVVGIKEGEGGDQKNLDLPSAQEDLIQGISGVNKNTIVVLNAGSVITMNNWIDSVPATIEMWYGGEEGGTALADILFGDYNPGGRLPLTFYKSIDQLPPMNDYDIRKGRTYMYMKEEPLFPFGYGLSYTEFEYSNLKLDQKKIGLDGKLKISVDVKNIGDRKGDEVVQLYIQDVERSTGDQPIKQLRGFKRITLDSGEAKTINFELKSEDLAFYDEDLNFIVEPGTIEVMMGSSSKDIRLIDSFEITESLKPTEEWKILG